VPDLDPTPSNDVPRPAAPIPWKDRIDLLTQAPTLSPARIAGGVAVALVLVVAAWLLLRTPASPPVDELLPLAGTSGEPASVASSTTSTTTGVVVAHAAGAVNAPGVYRLDAGARVTDLIDAAGGPTPDADLDRLNLAALVADGERVYVPRVGEVVAATDLPNAEADAPAGPLDLNTASLAQLEELPGIGPATAQAIIDERDRRGGFTAVDQLLDVRGIGPAKLDAIRDLVTV
jgi:competence protein ComEA